MCVMCVRVPVEARQECKGLQLELQTTVRCLAWVLGTELGLLARAEHVPNHCAVSSVS